MNRALAVILLSAPCVLWLSACGWIGYDSYGRDAGAGMDGSRDAGADGAIVVMEDAADASLDAMDDASDAPAEDAGEDGAVDGGRACPGTCPGADACIDGRCASEYVDLAAGANHICAVRADGQVACWGYNEYGELGDGTGSTRPFPRLVPGVSDAVEVRAGAGVSCVLRRDSSVMCWGVGFALPLGDERYYALEPEVIPFPEPPIDLAVNHDNGCAIVAGGRLYCWGEGTQGQVGDGSTEDRHTPVLVPGLSGVVQVEVEPQSTCARTEAGAFYCWGTSREGRLMLPDTGPYTTPQLIPGVTDVRAFTMGAVTCVLQGDGRPQCWGYGGNGALGDGTRTPLRLTMAPVLGVTDAVSVAAGDSVACAVRASGRAACWGANYYGQAGANLPDDYVPSPRGVFDLTDAVEVVVGSDFACALRATGTIVCWGSNDYGNLGVGSCGRQCDVPVRVPGLSSVDDVQAGGGRACARVGGEIYCWGLGPGGELGLGIGTGTFIGVRTPMPVAGITDAVALAVGPNNTYVLRATGAVLSFGAGYYGAVGDGAFTDRHTPVTLAGITDADGLVPGYSQACADDSGVLKCWGFNSAGQVGDGTTMQRLSPVTSLFAGPNTCQAGFGAAHICVCDGSGRPWCWGSNEAGQLGYGTPGMGAYSATPTMVPGLTNIVQIAGASLATGPAHTCARSASGALSCWGYNYWGQLGDETTTDSVTPRTIPGITARDVALSYGGTCAVKMDGNVTCWGRFEMDVPGSPLVISLDPTVTRLPVEARGLRDVQKLTFATRLGCALHTDRTVSCWGSNDMGGLGDDGVEHLRAPAALGALR